MHAERATGSEIHAVIALGTLGGHVQGLIERRPHREPILTSQGGEAVVQLERLVDV